MYSFKLLVLSISVIICLTRFVQAEYVGAVVEYQPLIAATPNETVETNLFEYIHNIETAQRNGVQIIVFPEYGLTGLVKNPEGYGIEIPSPGDNTTFANYWLEKLSHAAIAHQMYVVVNLLEKVKKEDNSTIYHNTNIVFDKFGKIVAKYRKINLFMESALTPGETGQKDNIFTTDFGVTFGTFICYDITWYNPSRTILYNTGVTDIVFPTAWVSYLPYYHSISVHSGYALSAKVNVLAANLNNIQNGTGGSGIYGANGTIFSSYISGAPGTKIQFALVKNAPPQAFETYGMDILEEDVPNIANFIARKAVHVDKYEHIRLNLSEVNIKKEVCHKGFCCTFSINVSPSSLNSSDIYQVMAYKGRINVGEERNVKICAILACQDSDVSTCGDQNVKLATRLESFSIKTNVAEEPDRFYQPFSLTSNLLPLINGEFNSSVKEGTRSYFYSVPYNTQNNVIAAGICGNKGVVLEFSLVLMVAIVCFNRIFN